MFFTIFKIITVLLCLSSLILWSVVLIKHFGY